MTRYGGIRSTIRFERSARRRPPARGALLVAGLVTVALGATGCGDAAAPSTDGPPPSFRSWGLEAAAADGYDVTPRSGYGVARIEPVAQGPDLAGAAGTGTVRRSVAASAEEVQALATALGAQGAVTEQPGGWSTTGDAGSPRLVVLKDAGSTWIYGVDIACDLSQAGPRDDRCRILDLPGGTECLVGDRLGPPRTIDLRPPSARGEARCRVTIPPTVPQNTPSAEESFEAAVTALGPVVAPLQLTAEPAPESLRFIPCGLTGSAPAKLDGLPVVGLTTVLAIDVCTPGAPIYAGEGSLGGWEAIADVPTVAATGAVDRVNASGRTTDDPVAGCRDEPASAWCRTVTPTAVAASRTLIVDPDPETGELRLLPAWRLDLTVERVRQDGKGREIDPWRIDVVAIDDRSVITPVPPTNGAPATSGA